MPSAQGPRRPVRHVVGATAGQHEHHHVAAVEDPQIPTVADLAFHAGVHQPTRLVGVPQRLRPRPLHQGVVQRFQKRQQPPQAVGDRSQRQRQAFGGQIVQQAIGGPVKQVLVQKHAHPDGHAQDALGQELGRRRGGDDAGIAAAATGGPIASSANEPAMGPHLDFQDRAVVGSREGSERLTALGAVPPVGRHVEGFLDDRQVGVVAAFGSGASALLAARSRRLGWRGRRCGVGRRGGVFGLAAEQALFQGANAALQRIDFFEQALLALHGALVQALPVGGLAPRFKLGGQAWADGARLGGHGRR